MRADSFFRIDLPATAHCHHHLPTTDAKHRQGTHFVANTLRVGSSRKTARFRIKQQQLEQTHVPLFLLF
ncbi:hypothetical protein HNY73_005439 [Argiope bruennichi]|uniref:Uncharacterized protein n=1 Tax=Argiope bruennichi TaxID=94029 RepID=A0A8T0FHG4_ARGBR|nr:hypothetical protein HNY73_005439 [Argiope bruennichi]